MMLGSRKRLKFPNISTTDLCASAIYPRRLVKNGDQILNPFSNTIVNTSDTQQVVVTAMTCRMHWRTNTRFDFTKIKLST